MYLVLSWNKEISFRLETCESFLSVDGCYESVVLITCDKNVKNVQNRNSALFC